MKTIEVSVKVLTRDEVRLLKEQQPHGKHVEVMVDEECYIQANGETIAIYKKIDFDLTNVREACLRLKFEPSQRTSGIISYTYNINASPRNGKRANKCRFSRLKYKHPRYHEHFIYCAKQISKSYLKYFRKTFAAQIKTSYGGQRKIDIAYMIRQTPFTGGVVNKDSAMPYHYDSSNTKNGISCMVIMKNGVAGGELILPELNIGFACQDGYMLLFNGEAYLHGVTKIIKPTASAGYRYTIVYYNNNGMALCEPPDEEELRYRLHLENQTAKRRQALQ